MLVNTVTSCHGTLAKLFMRERERANNFIVSEHRDTTTRNTPHTEHATHHAQNADDTLEIHYPAAEETTVIHKPVDANKPIK